MSTIVKIIGREVKLAYHLAMKPLVMYNRYTNFPKTEPAGVMLNN